TRGPRPVRHPAAGLRGRPDGRGGRMVSHRTYRHTIPGIDMDELGGLLIVVEGPDSSGRSTQIWLLSRWLEQLGFAVEQMGLKRSKLVANELEQAKEGNVGSPRTL